MPETNFRLPGVKRLMREAKELSNPTAHYHACPLEENIFEWHFTIRGPAQTPYEGGIFHGRIIFPTDYPMKPPEIIFLTPNGRFQENKKICLSVSSFHPELWRPCWGVRTMLLAIIGFFPTRSEGAIGSTHIPDAEKIRLAQMSQNWVCDTCRVRNADILLPEDAEEVEAVVSEAAELQDQIYIAQKDVEIPNLLEIDEISEKSNKSSGGISACGGGLTSDGIVNYDNSPLHGGISINTDGLNAGGGRGNLLSNGGGFVNIEGLVTGGGLTNINGGLDNSTESTNIGGGLTSGGYFSSYTSDKNVGLSHTNTSSSATTYTSNNTYDVSNNVSDNLSDISTGTGTTSGTGMETGTSSQITNSTSISTGLSGTRLSGLSQNNSASMESSLNSSITGLPNHYGTNNSARLINSLTNQSSNQSNNQLINQINNPLINRLSDPAFSNIQTSSIRNRLSSSSTTKPISEDKDVRNIVDENTYKSINKDDGLTFPWVKEETIKIEKGLLTDIFPLEEPDLRCRSPPVMEFKFPKYDWKEEEKAKKNENPTTEPATQNQPVLIPNTRILQESAYDFRFHLRSSAMLIIYVTLLVVLAKKLIYSVVLLIDSLVE